MNRPSYGDLREDALRNIRSEAPDLRRTNRAVGSTIAMIDDTRGVATKANSKSNWALGAVALAAGGLLLGNNQMEQRFTSGNNDFGSRLAAVERRTQPVLDIREYLLDGSCRSLGGQVAESNNDRQRNLTDCRFTQEQVGEDPHAFVRSVISPEYRDSMLRLADRPDDRSWDAFSPRNLERLLDRGYVGVIAQQAPQRAAPAAIPSQPRRTATTTRPTPVTQPQQCATDYVNIRRGGFFGIGSVDRTLPINDCRADYAQNIHNLISGVCRNGYNVNGANNIINPPLYIARLNVPGQSQTFNISCYYPPQTHSSGGGGNTGGGISCGGDCGGGNTGGGRGPEAGGSGGQTTQ